MSQSAFLAVLVGVTALLRRPSLLRGRGCGWRALASAASRSDLAARGFDLAARGFGFIAYGFGFRCLPLRLGCPWFRLRCLSRWVRCSWFRLRCFSLRLRCSWLRLPRLAALGSPLLASAWLLGLRLPRIAALSSLLLASASPLAALSSLLLASTWLLVVSVFAARGFDFRRLPR